MNEWRCGGAPRSNTLRLSVGQEREGTLTQTNVSTLFGRLQALSRTWYENPTHPTGQGSGRTAASGASAPCCRFLAACRRIGGGGRRSCEYRFCLFRCAAERGCFPRGIRDRRNLTLNSRLHAASTSSAALGRPFGLPTVGCGSGDYLRRFRKPDQLTIPVATNTSKRIAAASITAAPTDPNSRPECKSSRTRLSGNPCPR